MARQSYTYAHGPAIDVVFSIENGMIQNIDLSPFQTKQLKWSLHGSEISFDIKSSICEWMESYGRKQPQPMSLPLNWKSLSPFTFEVLNILKTIPFSQSLTYGQVANLIGKPNAARAVGQACGRNPFLLLIPCHRVLAANNRLGGFSGGGPDIKKQLLQFENHLITNNL